MLPCEQMIEIALGLEASQRPFIWVVPNSDEFKNWLSESGFEERVKDRGLLIKGWAPQLLILTHSAVGGFFTHCGSGSVLEGIIAGVPLLTCPIYGDHHCNEKFVLDVKKIGVSSGAKSVNLEGDVENIRVVLNRENVQKAVVELFSEGEEAKERRERVKELKKLAQMAVEDQGSSSNNLKLFIQEILKQKTI